METLSDIVAQMRGRGEDGRMDRRLWLDYADRIEAIDSADVYTPGNAAAMREALERVVEIADREWKSFRETPAMKEMRDVCTSALSAPARQCDVGTAEEQEARYKMMGEVYHTLTLTNALAWAQTPYEEERKGDGDGE